MANITPIQKPETLDGTRERINRQFNELNQDIIQHKESSQAHEANAIKYTGAVVGANNAKQAIDNIQTQINTLVLNGDSSAAAAQAAVDANGHDYGNLKLRLDTEHTQLSEQLAETVKVVNVLAYGVVGDDVADDTTALELAKTDALAIPNTVLYIPAEVNLYIPGGIDLFGIRNVICEGQIRTDFGSFIDVGYNSAKPDQTQYKFGFVKDGTLRVSGIKNTDLQVNRADHLMFYANGDIVTKASIAYNRIQLGLIQHLEFFSEGSAIGWINENKFFGGRIFRITMDGNYNHNHNVFFSPSLEGGAVINILKGRYNSFYDVRFEGTNYVTFGADTDNNTLIRNWYSNRFAYFTTLNSALSNIEWVDHGTANNIISLQDLVYHNRKVIEYHWNSNNYNVQAIIKHANTKTLSVNSNWASIYNSGLIPLDSDFGFIAQSNKALFRVRLTAYDENKQIIPQFPDDFVNWVGSSIINEVMTVSQNGSNIAFLVTNSNSNVKYVNIELIAGDSTADQHFDYLRIFYKEIKTLPLQLGTRIYNSLYQPSNTPITKGNWETGDEVEITSGGVRLRCTAGGSPGTWAPVGIIGATKMTNQPNSTASTVAALTTDFNSLLEKLRTAGLM